MLVIYIYMILLGMAIKKRKDKKVELHTHKIASDTVEHFRDIVNYKVTSPCGQHLWDLNNEAPSLSKEKAELFHSITGKLLYTSKEQEQASKQQSHFLQQR